MTLSSVHKNLVYNMYKSCESRYFIKVQNIKCSFLSCLRNRLKISSLDDKNFQKLHSSEQNRSPNPGYMHMYIDNQTLDRQCFLSADINLEIKNLIIETEQ